MSANGELFSLFTGGHRFAAPEELPFGGYKFQSDAAPRSLQVSAMSVGWDQHDAEGCDMTSGGLGCEWSNVCLQKAGMTLPGYLELHLQLG